MLCHWDGEEGRAVHAPGLATAPLNKESSTQRVLSQMSGPQLFKAGEVSVFCVSERGGELGGGGGKKDKKPVAGCYITKLKRRSEKPRRRSQEHARERSEEAVMMQYAHCRQTGGTGPSSVLTSDSEEAFVVGWPVAHRHGLGRMSEPWQILRTGGETWELGLFQLRELNLSPSPSSQLL